MGSERHTDQAAVSKNRKIESPAKVKRNPISINQVFNFAWSTFKRRYSLVTAILLTIFGAWVALEIVVIAGQRFGILVWGLAHLAFLVFFAGMEVGLLKICLALYDGEEPTFSYYRQLSPL